MYEHERSYMNRASKSASWPIALIWCHSTTSPDGSNVRRGTSATSNASGRISLNLFRLSPVENFGSEKMTFGNFVIDYSGASVTAATHQKVLKQD